MRYLVPVLLMIPFFAGSVAASENEAVPTMARILVEFNHFPSDDDKKALRTIIANEKTTEHERAVAEALMDVEHEAAADDKQALTALINDGSAGEGVQKLAEALLTLNHSLSEAEKAKLRTLTSQ